MFENKKIVYIPQQCFALLPQVNIPTNNLNFTEGDGIQFRLFSFLLYQGLKPNTKRQISTNTFCCRFKTKLQEKSQGSKILLFSFLAETTTKKTSADINIWVLFISLSNEKNKTFQVSFPFGF